jgi:hypothetical protein
MAEKFTAAVEQATGYPEILDYNDPRTPLGPFTRWQLYQNPNGTKENSSSAFLSSDIMLPNGRGVKGRRVMDRSQLLQKKKFSRRGLSTLTLLLLPPDPPHN